MKGWVKPPDDGAVDEAAVHRIWRGLERRRAGQNVRRASLRGAAVAVAVTVLALAAGTWFLSSTERDSAKMAAKAADSSATPAPGPLRRVDGRRLGQVLGGRDADETIVLSDGSRLVVRGAPLRVRANSGSEFRAALDRGTVVFDVVPGGPRRWAVDCGLGRVEVIGTAFRVERTATTLTVEVTRGEVLVRSDLLPHRARLLRGGESVRIGEGAGGSGAASDNAANGENAAQDGAGEDASRRAEPAERSMTSSGMPEGPRSLRDYLERADVARGQGDASAAAALLSQGLARYPSDPQASVAAYTLARLKLDALGDFSGAALAFERAIGLGLPEAIEENAYVRRVEALARAGQPAAAERAAAAFFRVFSNSTRATEVERWSGSAR